MAHALGRRLLIVRYAEVESMWMGETSKNVAAVFRLAAEQNAVLLFDEADAIASRRSTSVEHSFQQATAGATTGASDEATELIRQLDATLRYRGGIAIVIAAIALIVAVAALVTR